MTKKKKKTGEGKNCWAEGKKKKKKKERTWGIMQKSQLDGLVDYMRTQHPPLPLPASAPPLGLDDFDAAAAEGDEELAGAKVEAAFLPLESRM